MSKAAMRSWFTATALSFVACAAAQAAPPRQVEVDYDLLRNGMALAEVRDRLEHDAHSYTLTETWEGKGFLALRGEAVRTSRGTVTPGGLRPREFEDQRSGRDPVRVRFDPPGAAPASPQHQDQLSYVWSFAFAPPGTKPVSVRVNDGRHTTTYVYRADGHERLKTPAGEFDTLRLVKVKREPQDKGTEIWLAVDHGNVPVRILVTQKDGTRIDTVATRVAAPAKHPPQ
ncbi:MAG TPA: DUF3108 domain-containing protein [Burkholderiales bacterium]|nr:DUF3108 domain-containing protein [Burkholderiales bacterium]